MAPSHPRSKDAARRFLYGLGAFAVAVVVGYVAFTANQGRLPGTPATVVRAAFDDVGQLQPGSEVRQNGITIGQVSAIDLVDGKPVVTMKVNGGVPMYRDGRAGIWDQSALAQKFVEISAGNPGSGLLGDGVLSVNHTDSTHDLVSLLNVFDEPTRKSLAATLRNLGGGLAGYGPGLHDFVATLPGDLADIRTVSSTLVSARTDLPGLLQTSDRLSERFNGREQLITGVLHNTDETLRAVGTDGGRPLGETLTKLPRILDVLHTALDDAQQPLVDLEISTSQLHSGSWALGRATPDARGVLREGQRPLHQVPDVADDAKPAVDDLGHTLRDARPFAPKLADGLTSAAHPLSELARYGPDMSTFGFDLSNLIVNHDGWEHRLRIMSGAPSPTSLLINQVKDTHNPYPAPGEAIRERDPDGGQIPGR